jgi:hypothetical protein
MLLNTARERTVSVAEGLADLANATMDPKAQRAATKLAEHLPLALQAIIDAIEELEETSLGGILSEGS